MNIYHFEISHFPECHAFRKVMRNVTSFLLEGPDIRNVGSGTL